MPFAAGGPSDKIARDLAEALRKPLGQTVIVDNTGGAGGTIGSARVARATPDGYTLLVHHIGMATAPALYKKLSYKVPDDFEFLGLDQRSAVRPDRQADVWRPTTSRSCASGSLSNGGKVNLANAGVGSASHLCGLMLQSALKLNMTLRPVQRHGARHDRPDRRPGRPVYRLYEHNTAQFALIQMNIGRELSRRLRITDDLLLRVSRSSTTR